jgi:hypothetical protein
MDDTPRRKLGRLIGLAALVLIGSIAGIICGTFIADFVAGTSVGAKVTRSTSTRARHLGPAIRHSPSPYGWFVAIFPTNRPLGKLAKT